jgi:hypothetical protein
MDCKTELINVIHMLIGAKCVQPEIAATGIENGDFKNRM